MNVLSIISLFLGFSSIIFSFLIFYESKKHYKKITYFEVKNSNYCWLIIFNTSNSYITANDIYNELSIEITDNKKIFFFKIVSKNTKSRFDIQKYSINKIIIKTDYICPKEAIVLKIKSNTNYEINLQGILNNGEIYKGNYFVNKITHFPVFDFLLYMLYATGLAVLVPISLAKTDNIDQEIFAILVQISYVFALVLGLIIYENSKKLKGISNKIFYRTDKMVRRELNDLKNRKNELYIKTLKKRINLYFK